MYRIYFFWAMALALVLPSVVSAQSIWIPPSNEKSVTIEYIKPKYVGETIETVATAAQILTIRHPFSSRKTKMMLVVELPFAHGGIKPGMSNNLAGSSGSIFGNPYVGFELENRHKSVYTELGVRFPFHEEFGGTNGIAPGVGISTSFDRYEAYTPNRYALTGMVNLRNNTTEGLMVRVRTGPLFLIQTKPGPFEERSETIWGYSLQFWYLAKGVSIGSGVSGRTILSEPGLSLAERTINQVGLTLAVPAGRFKPGLHVRLPLDKTVHSGVAPGLMMNKELSVVFGMQLGVQFN